MNNNRRKAEAGRLRELLNEDAASAEEAAELLPAIQRMRRWEAPAGHPAEKARLAMRLVAEHRARQAGQRRIDVRDAWPVLMLRSQARVVERGIWVASALVMALGVGVTLLLDTATPSGGLPFALIAPLIAACGVAFLYGPESEPVMEIERGTPASMSLIWLARLTLVFGFDLGLGMAASGVLSILSPDISLWSLVMMWLAPMALLSALAFCVSAYRSDPVAGVLVSLVLWGIQVGKHIFPKGATWVDAIPNLMAAGVQLWVFAAALLLLGVGLWIAGRGSERGAWTEISVRD